MFVELGKNRKTFHFLVGNDVSCRLLDYYKVRPSPPPQIYRIIAPLILKTKKKSFSILIYYVSSFICDTQTNIVFFRLMGNIIGGGGGGG